MGWRGGWEPSCLDDLAAWKAPSIRPVTGWLTGTHCTRTSPRLPVPNLQPDLCPSCLRFSCGLAQLGSWGDSAGLLGWRWGAKREWVSSQASRIVQAGGEAHSCGLGCLPRLRRTPGARSAWAEHLLLRGYSWSTQNTKLASTLSPVHRPQAPGLTMYQSAAQGRLGMGGAKKPQACDCVTSGKWPNLSESWCCHLKKMEGYRGRWRRGA